MGFVEKLDNFLFSKRFGVFWYSYKQQKERLESGAYYMGYMKPLFGKKVLPYTEWCILPFKPKKDYSDFMFVGIGFVDHIQIGRSKI